MKNYIKIRGARVNNLKSVDLDIPLNTITCFFGASGSGKTSIAFHTLYAESKRRFLNSFPTYLKFFSERPAPVDVDEIKPVLPVFALPQINPIVGTRSIVADIMHLTELLQSHFYHYGVEICNEHKDEFVPYMISDHIKQILSSNKKHASNQKYYVYISRENFLELFETSPFPSRSAKSILSKSYNDFNEDDDLWEVSRFKESNLGDKLNTSLAAYLDKGCHLYLLDETNNKMISLEYKTGISKCPEISCKSTALAMKSPMHFSPYNALGACSTCNGFGDILAYDQDKLIDTSKSVKEDGVIFLNYKRFEEQKVEFSKALKRNKISLSTAIKDYKGVEKKLFWKILYEGDNAYHGFNGFFSYLEKRKYKMHVRIFLRSIQKSSLCTSCQGSRLNEHVDHFFLDDLNARKNKSNITLKNLMKLSIGEISEEFMLISAKANSIKSEKVENSYKKSLAKILSIVETANSIGLSHLSLMRKSKSLSAGEYQRLLLLKYLSYEGTGALFVFDEPSLGLSEIELTSLFDGFKKLIKNNNTVIIIDHHEFFMKKSDHLVEMGPGAGSNGGEVLFSGPRKDYKFKKLNSDLTPLIRDKGFLKKSEQIIMSGIEIYKKPYKDLVLNKNHITWVTGQSGSGKTSTLINTLGAALYFEQHGKHLVQNRGNFKKLINKNDFNDIIVIDANLNRYTSRSTVGSLTGLFPVLRKHFLKSSMAKSLGLIDGHLSYNSELGQCPKCEGRGKIIVEMQFLEDIELKCEDCKGQKLKPIYANLSDGVMTVHESYSIPVCKALENIKLTPKFQRVSEYMKLLNLDYLSLDRQINSLSGGEKQRIYLLSKLQKNISESLLFFENISFGLSKHELDKICKFLQQLSLQNNTLVIIDQNEHFKKITDNHLKF